MTCSGRNLPCLCCWDRAQFLSFPCWYIAISWPGCCYHEAGCGSPS